MNKAKLTLFLAGLFAVWACNLTPARIPTQGTTPDAGGGATESMPTATRNPTDTATPMPTIPPGFFPIAVGTNYNPRSAVLLGGSENGAWIEAADAAARLSGGETYTLYSPDGAAGTVTGSAPTPGIPCAQSVITWDPAPSATSLVGLGGPWNPLPRPPGDPAIADFPIYTSAAADWLAGQGIPVPDPLRLANVVRADLDGDGTMEAIISASRFSEATMHDVGAGDYTFVLLYREAAAETIPLAGKVYPEAKSMVFPMAFSLLTILDLNGDGRMEVLVHVSLWEGEGTRVFEYNGSAAEMVLSTSCSA